MYKFKFADVGEGIHEALLCTWYVKEGDQVAEGQELYSVETDKFTTDITTPVEGTIKKIYFEEGSEIKVGDLVVDIDDGSEAAAETAAAPQKTAEAETATEPQQVAQDEKPAEAEKADGASVVGDIKVSDQILESYHTDKTSAEKKPAKALATPVARNFAKVSGVDINLVTGTGRLGRVTKEDIQKYIDSNTKAAKPVQTVRSESAERSIERIKMSKIRETIAKNMVKSKYTIPHTSAMYEIDVTEVWQLIKEINSDLVDQSTKISFLPFVVKAVTAALKQHPMMNSELDEENKEILIKHFYNIGIAIDTTAGLAVPVLRDVDKMSILEIHNTIKSLSEQAEARELALDSMTGGTFTISNYGSIAGMFGTPVINHPEAAIVGVGRIYKKAVFDQDNNVVPAYTLPLSVSFDHRIIDGAEVSRFVLTLSKILSRKVQLILN